MIEMVDKMPVNADVVSVMGGINDCFRDVPIGTFEAGSSATMIEHGKNGFLYHSENVKELECILEQIWNLKKTGKDQEIRKNALQTIREIWSPENAAIKLLEDCNSWMNQ